MEQFPKFRQVLKKQHGFLAYEAFQRYNKTFFLGEPKGMYGYYEAIQEPWNFKEHQLTKCLELMAKYPDIRARLGLNLNDLLDRDNHFLFIIEEYMEAEKAAKAAVLAEMRRNPKLYQRALQEMNR
jgi:hypothetical protein